MKFTLSWLKDYLDTDATLDEISAKLTEIGLEVEAVEDRAAIYAPFKVAEVLDAQPHPDADRLKVCQVKTAGGVVQVVCGAPNARTGMKAVFAPAGTYIPGLDVTLKKSKIRGQDSNGMMVSEREMCLGEDHNGIIDLPADTPIGTGLAEIYGLNDAVIEINVTPNRPDCAGVRGIARDLAAAGLGKLKPLASPAIESKFESVPKVTLQFTQDDKNACPLFLGRLIKGVKNGPSPDWLQNRLKAVGLRPISALVDITNYFCIGMARPLHVYDADKLNGDIHVRMSKKGEILDALNDKSYELNDGMVVIADDRAALGLGGIVGGAETGCVDETMNVYLECAYFDPMTIARTGRDLQIVSDARYRFERGIDPAFTVEAVDLATQMILDLCGGEAGSVVQAGDVPSCTKTYQYNPAQYAKMIGVDVAADEQKRILESLGFSVAGNWSVIAPSWRPDILGTVDLVEEIARIRGYEAIPPVSVIRDAASVKPAETLRGSRTRKARTVLASLGLQECISWSFMDEYLAYKFGANDKGQAARLKLVNPISAELVQMRPSVLPNLVKSAQNNADRGHDNAALFEIGPVFFGTGLTEQPVVACGIRTGKLYGKHWSGTESSRTVDVFDAKADLLKTIEACGGPAGNLQVSRDAPAYYHPGRAGALRLGTNVIAYFGELHPEILDNMKVTVPVVGFELFLDNLPEQKKKGTALPLVDLPAFQPVQRDFAFLADEGVEADALVRAISLVDRNLITQVEIFDIYTGKGVDDGKKSVAMSVTLQPRDKTLTDAEIDGISQKIVAIVAQKTGAVLRG